MIDLYCSICHTRKTARNAVSAQTKIREHLNQSGHDAMHIATTEELTPLDGPPNR